MARETPLDTSVEPSKARRIYLLLADGIAGGALAPGDRLPGEPALATRHGVARATVRRALDQLAREGLIERRPGAGTFVREPTELPPIIADLANVFGNIEALGSRTEIRLLAFGYVTPPQAVAAAMKISLSERMQRSVRVRSSRDRPFSYLVSYVPEHIGLSYTETELASTPLFKLLERSGVIADRARQIIGAALAGPGVAEELDIEVGSPLVSVTRVTRAGADAVEHLHALYRPDRYVLSLDVERDRPTEIQL